MVKKLYILCFLFLITLLAGCEEDRSFTIEQVNIRAQLMEDGDLYVEELYSYHFTGEYNGTTRAIRTKGHDGVEFFEAYLPPPHTKLGDFTYHDAERLKVEPSDNTYRIHTRSKDEVKQVYYRYRLDHAVSKYRDTGEFYWAFFDSDNETDLNNLSIEIVLPQTIDSGGVNYYLHDRSGGLIAKVSDRSIHYETEQLPAGQKSEIHLLFPAEWLPDSPLTADENRKVSVIAQEEKLQARYALREENLAQAEKLSSIASGLILLAILYFAFLAPYKLAGLHRGHITRDELEGLDPLFVAYMHRKGKLKQKDITAGLFSLYQKGWLEISKIPAAIHYQQDPKASNSPLPGTSACLMIMSVISSDGCVKIFRAETVPSLWNLSPGRPRKSAAIPRSLKTTAKERSGLKRDSRHGSRG
ncbi:hypothetical protein J2TS4_40540 [Paenibacillus sp. J2TS4]|nr:hypothetical protein J2TS4_40540 [Paenibacillus sp. J2TS4]